MLPDGHKGVYLGQGTSLGQPLAGKGRRLGGDHERSGQPTDGWHLLCLLPPRLPWRQSVGEEQAAGWGVVESAGGRNAQCVFPSLPNVRSLPGTVASLVVFFNERFIYLRKHRILSTQTDIQNLRRVSGVGVGNVLLVIQLKHMMAVFCELDGGRNLHVCVNISSQR